MINIKEIFDIQSRVNLVTQGDNWYRTHNPYAKLAIIDEWGEFVRSIGYEWWKEPTVDLKNAIVELADIIAFYLTSLDTRFLEFKQYYNDNVILNVNSNYDFTKINKDNVNNIIISLTQESIKNNKEYLDIIKFISDIDSLALLLIKLLDNDNVDKYTKPSDYYIGKSALNIFRQLNGYNVGNYKKIWNIDGVEAEDNLFLYNYIINNKSIIFNDVMDYLNNTYNQ